MFRNPVISVQSLATCALGALLWSACGTVDFTLPKEPSESTTPGDNPTASELNEDPTIYDASAAGDRADAVDLSFQVVDSFRLPDGVALGETRRIFRSAAAFKSFTGVDPVGVDFPREHAILYSAGTLATTGSQAKITRLRVTDSGGTLQVFTQLVAPGLGCPSEAKPDRPYVLVRFTPPSPVPTTVRYYRSSATATACPTDPWPSCSGTLSDAGIDTIVTTHTKGGIFYRSSLSAYNSDSYQLGTYKITRWQRTCREEVCDAWKALPAPEYATGKTFLYYGGAVRRLIAQSDVVSYTFDIGGGMVKFCDRWGESNSDLLTDGTLKLAANLSQQSGCTGGGTSGAGGPEISDRYGNLYSLPGKVTDRCVELQKSTTKQIGPTVYEETRTVLSSSW